MWAFKSLHMSFKKIDFCFKCVLHVCSMSHLCLVPRGVLKRELSIPELELQSQVLGIEPRRSAREASALNHVAISPVPELYFGTKKWSTSLNFWNAKHKENVKFWNRALALPYQDPGSIYNMCLGQQSGVGG